MILLIFPIMIFANIFEDLLEKDKDYLLDHHFTCAGTVCQTNEKNIYDNALLDDAIKVVLAYLDHQNRVFKIELVMYLQDEAKNAFYEAITEIANKDRDIQYELETIMDKYGNHTKVIITDKIKKRVLVDFYKKQYISILKQYKTLK